MDTTEPAFSYNNFHINIKYALLAQHNSNWYEVKAKNEYALWIVQSGSLTIEYGQDKYFLSSGDVFFFYPQILYHASSAQGCSFIFIHFDAILGKNYQALHFYPFDGCYSFSGQQISRSANPFYAQSKDRLTAIISNIISLPKKEPFAELGMQGSLMLFLSEIMNAKYQENKAKTLSPNKSALARLQPVLIYINHHITEPIYIQELAHSIHLSEKYFITFFKKTMGITPSSYITQIKMKKALEYLHEQHYSVKEVAELVGYSDIYTFSKAFKKMYGVSPSKL